AEGDNGEFVDLDQVDMGRDDIQLVQIDGHTGGSNAGLDLRLLELTALAREMPGLPVTSAHAVFPSAGPCVSFLAGIALLAWAAWSLRPAPRVSRDAEQALEDRGHRADDRTLTHGFPESARDSRLGWSTAAIVLGSASVLSVGMAWTAGSQDLANA